MDPRLKALIEKRDALIAQARKHSEEHQKDGKWADGARQEQFQAMTKDLKAVMADITDLQTLLAAEAQQTADAQGTGRQIVVPPQGADAADVRVTATPEYRAAYDRYMRFGDQSEIGQICASMSIGVDPSGGYLVPDEFQEGVVMKLNAFCPIRQYATVIQIQGDRNIVIDDEDGDASWTGEENDYTLDDEGVGLIVLTGHKLTRLQKVSEELVQDGRNLDNFLQSKFARSFGSAEETAFTTGNGVNKPTGLVGRSELGVTAASGTVIDPDEIIKLRFSLKAPYRRNAVWMMNDTTLCEVATMKGGDGQYLWHSGLAAGLPDTILGQVVLPNASMADSSSGLKPIVYGDLSFYYIVDRGSPMIQRLVELYALAGQVGFKMARRVDANLTQTEAVKHLIMA